MTDAAPDNKYTIKLTPDSLHDGHANGIIADVNEAFGADAQLVGNTVRFTSQLVLSFVQNTSEMDGEGSILGTESGIAQFNPENEVIEGAEAILLYKWGIDDILINGNSHTQIRTETPLKETTISPTEGANHLSTDETSAYIKEMKVGDIIVGTLGDQFIQSGQRVQIIITDIIDTKVTYKYRLRGDLIEVSRPHFTWDLHHINIEHITSI